METIAIIGLIQAGVQLFEYIAKVRTAAKQAGEWTAEQEAAFQGLLDKAKSDPAWQPQS